MWKFSEYKRITPQSPLPDRETVFRWWDEYGMLPNIRAHSLMVAKVAVTLADWLIEAGEQLYRPAVEIGALVHDLAKTICLGTDKLHAKEGERILERLGYPELAYLVATHVYLPEDHPLDETMVVNYADKRVTHDRVVDLDSRFAYIKERYGRGDPERLRRMEWGYQRARAAEAQLFAAMGGRHRPEDLFSLDGGGGA